MMGFMRFRFGAGVVGERFFLCTILLIQGLLLGRIAVVNAPMYDEVAHLPSGLIHWKHGNFDLYRVNPPLMRLIAAFPLLFVSPQLPSDRISDSPYARPEFNLGRAFLQQNGFDSFRYFTICRWAQIPVTLFGGWVCYQWAKELYGNSSARIALLLWCFCPSVLAWGSTITPDIGGAAFGVAAGYSFWRWLAAPSWKGAMLAGLALGLAQLSKSTWIILFVLWPALWLAWLLLNGLLIHPRWPRRVCSPDSLPVSGALVRCLQAAAGHHQPVMVPAPQLAVVMGLGLYILNLGYGFEGSFRHLGDFDFISRSLGGDSAHTIPGNRFRESFLASVPVPLPANYLKGLDVQKYDFEKGKWSYLCGEQKRGGWYHYYLCALAIKTPLGTLFLAALLLILMVCLREYREFRCNDLVLLAPAVAIFVLVSSQTGFNRYLRYVLPAIPFLYVFCSRVGKAFELHHSLLRIAITLGIAASIIGSLWVYPHSMSYFNLAAGGPRGGPAYLLDANIDWGQDLLELKRFVDQHPEIGSIGLAYFGIVDPKLAQFSHESIVPVADSDGEMCLPEIRPGWYAISVNHLFGYRHYEADEPVYTCFRRLSPVAMAGYSIYIYHVTPEVINRLNGPCTDNVP
ncbi:MAG: glycosyltransferase family 39 protein [Planctomycetota bacterium]